MQIGAGHHAPLVAERVPPAELAIGRKGLAQLAVAIDPIPHELGDAPVQLKALQLRSLCIPRGGWPEGLAAALAQGLGGAEGGAQRQQVQPAGVGGTPLQPLGVEQLAAQQLHATADAEHLAATGRIGPQRFPQVAALQCRQIPQSLFAARHDHGRWLAQLLSRRHPAQLHRGLGLQGIEIGEVAQRRQLEHRDLQLGAPLAAAAFQQIERILRGE